MEQLRTRFDDSLKSMLTGATDSSKFWDDDVTPIYATCWVTAQASLRSIFRRFGGTATVVTWLLAQWWSGVACVKVAEVRLGRVTDCLHGSYFCFISQQNLSRECGWIHMRDVHRHDFCCKILIRSLFFLFRIYESIEFSRKFWSW